MALLVQMDNAQLKAACLSKKKTHERIQQWLKFDFHHTQKQVILTI